VRALCTRCDGARQYPVKDEEGGEYIWCDECNGDGWVEVEEEHEED
jgi:hypothetical protein